MKAIINDVHYLCILLAESSSCKLKLVVQVSRKEYLIYSPNTPSRTARATLRADQLFISAYRTGQIKGLWAFLRRQSRELPLLDQIDSTKVVRRYAIEQQAIRLEAIRGSEGKVDEYDIDFYPLHRRDKQRWIGVATNMLRHPNDLLPIDVVQVGDIYYVSNGHHRVSVALRLGYIFIDANVTVWEVEE